MFPDDQIIEWLDWLYNGRKLCKWCHHPRHLPKTRGLCNHCYGLAKEFRKRPTKHLAISITIAMNEGARDIVKHDVSGLEIEHLFEEVAQEAFAWRKATDNPFFQSANTWGEKFSGAQRKLLYHEFSMITREIARRQRRGMGDAVLMDMQRRNADQEIEADIREAQKAVEESFLKE